MRNFFKYCYLTTLGIILILFSGVGNVEASNIVFKDVPQTYWAYTDVKWAVDKGIIYGYTDGNFKPNGELTESQYVAVMTRYLNPNLTRNLEAQKHSTVQYNYLKSRDILLPGHTDASKRNKPISRLSMAKALYHSQGNKGTDNQAIDWMYDNKLTNGKGISKDRTIDFGSADHLQRVQVAAFFKRAYDNNITEIVNESTKNIISGTKLYDSLNTIFENKGFNLTKRDGYPTDAQARMTNPDMTGLVYAPRIDMYSDKEILSVVNFSIEHELSYELMAEVAKAYGLHIDVNKLADEMYKFSKEKSGIKIIMDGEFKVQLTLDKESRYLALGVYNQK